jgi:hypothetical protein
MNDKNKKSPQDRRQQTGQFTHTPSRAPGKVSNQPTVSTTKPAPPNPNRDPNTPKGNKA